jgi:hypothetical protein
MEIAVDGWRPSAVDWDAVRSVPTEQLPQLTSEQREVARKLGFPEVEYARNTLAGERSQDRLLAKTERLGNLLSRSLAERASALGVDTRVSRITLRTIQDRFDVEVQVNGRVLPLRIEESMVDEYFEAGSSEAEQRLTRVLDRALASVSQ